MIFDAIKKLFNKDENTEQIEYLGTDKDGNKIYEGYYHEFKGIPWVFNKTTYTREEFLKAFYECLEEHNVNRDNLPPLVEPEILVSYEAWIESKSQLHPNEYLYEDDELEEYDKEDGMWQVEIYARLKADNGQYFTTEELLFKIHNLMANKELGDHVFFENLAYDDHEFEADDAEDVDDDDEGTPVFVVWLGS
ncbi:hypothetical protein [uncultured Veillonella sp.]|uniref:hypothetical protein n=1 Tax=uncultured Veillonella sp. TaxID=159268 RepID=UPI0026312375|nr:hypothetical protein [uncultured Veillonella sp.]